MWKLVSLSFGWWWSHIHQDLWGQFGISSPFCTHVTHPNQPAKPTCHPFISDGVLFDLHSIHKKMIAWCGRYCLCHWVGWKAIFIEVWGQIWWCAAAHLMSSQTKLPNPCTTHSYLMEFCLFDLHTIHKKMIAWCSRYFICHWVGWKVIFIESCGDNYGIFSA